MRIAFYQSNKDKEPAIVDATWEEVVALLTVVTPTSCGAACKGKDCPEKYGEAWSPVDMEEGDTRANENVLAVTVAVFDLDHIEQPALEDVRAALIGGGHEYVIHSTHTPNCYRLVMPLTRDITPAEWPTFWATSVAELSLPVDKAVKDLARIFFLPTIPQGRQPFTEHMVGHSLDVDAIIAAAPRRGTVMTASPDPVPEDIEPVDITDLRGELVSYRQRKAGSTDPADAERYELLGRVLQGTSLSSRGGRDVAVNKAAALLAFILPAGTPAEGALELLRPSIAAMPYSEQEDEDCAHFMERAERSWGRAVDRRAERDAERGQHARAQSAGVRDILSKYAVADAPKGMSVKVDASAFPDEDKWRALLQMRADMSGPKACGYNAHIILTHAPGLAGSIRFNEVSKEVEVHGGPFAQTPLDVLETRVQNWLQWEWNIGLSSGEVATQLFSAARENAYDPLRDYLEGITWDGKPRVERLFRDYFNANEQAANGRDITEHLHRIGRKWLISAVARALQPGCQVDTVLVLEGRQGVRKTSALRVLGGQYTTETDTNLGDKDAKMLTASHWLVELGEGASMKRSELASMKMFLTTRVDTYRRPYGKNVVKTPRRCVFVMTVNPEEGYLTDHTGNRRYWPVYCNRIDLETLTRDRDQLWAEAVALYRTGERWWLDESEQREADALTEERESESATEALVAKWFYSLHPTKRPKVLDTVTVAKDALQLTPDRAIAKPVQMELGNAMRRLGFERARVMLDGRRTWVYCPTKAMLEAKQGGKPDHLRLVREEQHEPTHIGNVGATKESAGQQ